MEQRARSRLVFTVAGRVQGVGFREATRAAASSCGVTGWVENLADGRVAGVAEGDLDALQRFSALLRSGPPLSRVDTVETHEHPATGEFSHFTVRRATR